METMDAVTSGVKAHIRISKKFDADTYLLFAVGDLTDQGRWWRLLDLSNTGGSAASPFANGDDVVISLVATGDKGDKG